MPLKPIKTNNRYKNKINYILKHGDSEGALDLAISLNKRLPVLEPVILKSYATALEYAIIILGKKWPELEKIIDGNPRLVKHYNIHTRQLYS
jgi:hypothetical protein